MGLSDFLLARIAEDEVKAKAAVGDARPDWVVGCEETSDGENAFWAVEALGEESEWFADLGSKLSDHARALHMARHDPARVLAECEAKRRIVEDQSSEYVLRDDVPNDFTYEAVAGVIRVGRGGNAEDMTVEEFTERYWQPPPPSDVLKFLALPYADHPDYDPEWKP